MQKLSQKKINLISDANSSKIVYRKKLENLLFNCSYRAIKIYCYADMDIIWQRMLNRSSFISTKEQLNIYADEIELSSDILQFNTGELTPEQILMKVINKYERK